MHPFRNATERIRSGKVSASDPWVFKTLVNVVAIAGVDVEHMFNQVESGITDRVPVGGGEVVAATANLARERSALSKYEEQANHTCSERL